MNNNTRNFLIVLCLIAICVIGGYIVTHPRSSGVVTTTTTTTTGQTTTNTDTTPVTPVPTSPNYEPYSATLVGEYLCLPHTNTGGPQTLECALGMKTGDGKYFALDFSSMSQVQGQLATGDRFSAHGTVTPVQRLSTNQWQKYPILGIFTVTDSFRKLSPTTPPPGTQTSATLHASIGQSVTGLSVTVTPLEVTDDSRCPQGVACIWAGTVHVRTKVKNEVGTSEVTFELGKSITLGAENIALTVVSPAKTQDSIATSTYVFTYEVTKK
ncbi:MAG TPA: hypothetical protein VF438_04080 [Candidatus Paceibacterota bacterium]